MQQTSLIHCYQHSFLDDEWRNVHQNSSCHGTYFSWATMFSVLPQHYTETSILCIMPWWRIHTHTLLSFPPYTPQICGSMDPRILLLSHPSIHPSTLHSYVLLTLATAPFYLSCVLLYILDFTTNRKVLTICKIGDRVGNFS